MMIQLILTMCIVNFKLTSAQPPEQIVDQAVTYKVKNNGENGFRENFQNLFDSIAKNDLKKSEIYEKVLKKEIGRERRAFDEMKEELQIARHRNSNRKRNLYKRSNIDEIIVTKRETHSGNVSTHGGIVRELPSEGDDYRALRTKNKVYVDKSKYITKLLARNKTFMRICRPRRFGKSNFIQMLESFFKGDDLSFPVDLAVNANSNRQTYPVIHLDFNAINVTTTEDFQIDLKRTLVRIGNANGLKLKEEDSVEEQLRALVENLSAERSQSVVVLVDEYDWPVRRQFENEDASEAEKCSRFLKKFFAQFRVLAAHVKLLFLTCTMRLQLMDVRLKQNGLATLEDITYDPEFSAMIGLTNEELVSHFEPHIKAMTKGNETFQSLLQTLRDHYSGYCFSRNTSSACQVYNFHSVVSCLRNQKVDRFWHRTRKANFNSMEDMRRQRVMLNSFTNRFISTDFLLTNFDHDQPLLMVHCMLLRGYLTFRSYDEKYDEYEVDFPNQEIRDTFVKEMIKTLPASRLSTKEILEKCTHVRDALFGGKTGDFIKLLNDLAIRYADTEEDTNASKYEYTERIARLLLTCDIYCVHDGNYFHDKVINLRVELPDEGENEIEYVFEFEWKKTAEWAMNRLLNMTQIPAFHGTFGFTTLYLMGVNFNPESRMIDEWIRTTYSKQKCTDVKSSHSHYSEKYSYLSTKKKCVGLPNE